MIIFMIQITTDQYLYSAIYRRYWKNMYLNTFNIYITNNVVTPSQSGFIPGDSTIHQPTDWSRERRYLKQVNLVCVALICHVLYLKKII